MTMLRAKVRSVLLAGSAAILVASAALAASGSAEYLNNIRQKESSQFYGATTDLGTATGAYQFTVGSLQDLGVVSNVSGKTKWGAGEWDNVTWNTADWGVSSRQEFLNSPAVQDAVMAAYTQKQWGSISNGSKSYLGQSINGVVLDESAMLSAAHMLGSGGFNQWASCGFQAHCISASQAAANNMTQQQLADHLMNRMAQNAGLDVSDLTNGSFTPGGGGAYDAMAVAGAGPAVDIPPGAYLPRRATKFQEVPPFQGVMVSL